MFFVKRVILDCLKKCQEAKRNILVIQWKETGETISTAVDGFNLQDLLAIKPPSSMKQTEKCVQNEYDRLQQELEKQNCDIRKWLGS